MSNRSQAPVLDAARAQFILGAVSLTVASRGKDLRPSVCTAVGCRVSEDYREVTVLLPRSDVGELLEHVRLTGTIAMVAAHPISHEALQLKAIDAREVAPTPADDALVASYLAAFAEQLAGIGMSDRFVAEVRRWGKSGIVAIGFTATAAFLQTPGPRAGEELAPAI